MKMSGQEGRRALLPENVAHQASGNISVSADTDAIYKMKLDDDEFQEFGSLLKDAEQDAVISVQIVVINMVKFFLDEDGPIWLLFTMLSGLLGLFGEEIKMNLGDFYSFLYTVFINFWISFLLCIEKREACSTKQGRKGRSFSEDWKHKFVHLFFVCCYEYRQQEKRTSKIKIIKENINLSVKSQSQRWVKKRALMEMRKIFRRDIRYIWEKTIVIGLRSLPLAIYDIYSITDFEATTPMSTINYWFKIGHAVWFIAKMCTISRKLTLAKRRYVTATQLWGSVWAKNNSNCEIQVPNYSKAKSLETKYLGLYSILDFFIHFAILAGRLLVIIKVFLLNWLQRILVLLHAPQIALVIFFAEMLNMSKNSQQYQFENSPTGYYNCRQIWIHQIIKFIGYNHGYSIHKLKGFFNLGVCTLTISQLFIVVLAVLTKILPRDFLILYSKYASKDFSSFNMNASSVEKSIRNFDSIAIMNKDREYAAQNIVSASAILCIWVFAFSLEICQKYLPELGDDFLNDFDKFPFLDAGDFYRSLNNIFSSFLSKEMYRKYSACKQNNDLNKAKILSERLTRLSEYQRCKTILINLMELTLLESTNFNNIWHIWIEKDIIPNQFRILNQLTNHRYELDKAVNIKNIDISVKDLGKLDINGPVTSEELIAVRMIKSMQQHDHPLEPYDAPEECRLFSNIFRLIQIPQCNFEEKQKHIKRFLSFCSVFDIQLCKMDSLRMKRTFKILQVEIGKVYLEDVN